MPCRSEQREHDTDHQQDHAECPEQRHSDEEPEHQEHDSENYHGLYMPTSGEDQSVLGQDRQEADVTLLDAPALTLTQGQMGGR